LLGGRYLHAAYRDSLIQTIYQHGSTYRLLLDPFRARGVPRPINGVASHGSWLLARKRGATIELQSDELPALLYSLQSELSAESTYRELITGLNSPLEVIGKCDLLNAGVEALPSLAELRREFPAVSDRPLCLAR
jgi:hypothetical protein